MGPVLLPVIEPEKRVWSALQPLALVGLVDVLYENAAEVLAAIDLWRRRHYLPVGPH